MFLNDEIYLLEDEDGDDFIGYFDYLPSDPEAIGFLHFLNYVSTHRTRTTIELNSDSDRPTGGYFIPERLNRYLDWSILNIVRLL